MILLIGPRSRTRLSLRYLGNGKNCQPKVAAVEADNPSCSIRTVDISIEAASLVCGEIRGEGRSFGSRYGPHQEVREENREDG